MTRRDVSASFADDQSDAAFVQWVPQSSPPYGMTRRDFKAAKWRALAAGILLVALFVLFAVVGTQTFWRTRMTWQTWYTLSVVIVMLSALVLDIWDTSLTFFAANTALLLARVITVSDALAGFSNEGIISTGVMFIIAKVSLRLSQPPWFFLF